MNESGRLLLEALLALLLFLGVLSLFPEQLRALRRLSLHEERMNTESECREMLQLQAQKLFLPTAGETLRLVPACDSLLALSCGTVESQTSCTIERRGTAGETIPLSLFKEGGFTLIETIVGLLLCALVFSAVLLSFQQSIQAGTLLRRDLRDRDVVERASLLLRGHIERALRFPSLPGIAIEHGEGELHRLLRTHSSTPASADQAVLAVRELSPEGVLTRAPDLAFFCERSFGFPTNSVAAMREANSGFVLITLDGNVDIRSSPRRASGPCPHAWEFPTPLSLGPFQFSSRKSVVVPPLSSIVGAIPIEDAVLIFLDREGSLRYFSLLSHSNQVFAEPLKEFGLRSFSLERKQYLELSVRGTSTKRPSVLTFPLPSSSLSPLDVVL